MQNKDSREKDEEPKVYTLFHLKEKLVKPLTVTINVNGTVLTMEVNTGAAVSVINELSYKCTWPVENRPLLKKTNDCYVQLQTYSGEKLPVLGELSVVVHYKGKEERLGVVVIARKGPTLMGRNWLECLHVQWLGGSGIHHVTTTSNHSGLKEMLDQHQTLFKDELGQIKGVKATIRVDKHAAPRFFKPRPVPFALREKVEMELARLERVGIIQPVQFSEWGALVPVLKKDGSIRVCGDYKLTVNRVSSVDAYPLPRVDDLLASTTNTKIFTKLDLSNAYLQLELDDDSQKLVTISTHKGLYKYNRLPFGVSSAPSIFQRTMEGIVAGIPNVVVYIDDILVVGSSKEDHLRTLDIVLKQLEDAGLRLKLAKCAFMMGRVEYLGHLISGDRIQPTEDKKRAILEAPTTTEIFPGPNQLLWKVPSQSG